MRSDFSQAIVVDMLDVSQMSGARLERVRDGGITAINAGDVWELR